MWLTACCYRLVLTLSKMASDISQDHLPSLFKDGISEDLYKLMWSKDELNFGPPINIPDTIVYKFGQPTSWYFTALNGRVKKKNKHNLISAKIEEVFNKHVLGYDVLAYFINVPVENDQNLGNAPITIEYLDRTALNDFLYNRKKEVNGFLQRFIEPKTTHNEVCGRQKFVSWNVRRIFISCMTTDTDCTSDV